MKTTHTPGPWRFEPRKTSPTHEITFGESRFRPTCIVGYVYKGHGLEVAEANARLIAAAPDLLETLEAAAEDVEEMGCTCSDRSEGHEPDCVGFMHAQKARAALAKARGE